VSTGVSPYFHGGNQFVHIDQRSNDLPNPDKMLTHRKSNKSAAKHPIDPGQKLLKKNIDTCKKIS
jgi:hypothetical protein